eukprot:s438_g30.t1
MFSRLHLRQDFVRRVCQLVQQAARMHMTSCLHEAVVGPMVRRHQKEKFTCQKGFKRMSKGCQKDPEMSWMFLHILLYAETLPCPKSTTVQSNVHPKGDLFQSCSIQAGSIEGSCCVWKHRTL